MRASEYLQQTINRRTGIEARVGRFPTPFNPGQGAVVYRLAGTDRIAGIDGPTDAVLRYYEIECAAPTSAGAQQISADILDEIQPLAEVFGEFDHSTHSQQVGGYYAHIVTLALPGTIAP